MTIEKTGIKYSPDECDPSELCIEELYVEPAERGKGKARELVKKAIKYAIEKGFKKIGLYAYGDDDETDTNRLIEFYESFGFRSDCDDRSLMTLAL